MALSFSYVGTLVGAGFASGREIFNFFINGYGTNGLKGVLIAGLLLIIGGVLFLRLSAYGLYDDFLYRILDRRGSVFIDMIFIFLLWGSVLVMGTGGASLFKEGLALPGWLGLLVTFVVIGFFACFGADGVRKFNLFFTPVLTVYLVIVAWGYKLNYPEIQIVNTTGSGWCFGALLFSTYNLLFAFPALLALGRDIKEKWILWGGGILGGLLLFSLLIHLSSALLAGYAQAGMYEIPILMMTGWLGRYGEIGFYLVLWIALLSTGIVNLYTLASRLKRTFSLSIFQVVLIILVACLPFSVFGFANLVQYLYSFYGYLAILVFIWLFSSWLIKRGFDSFQSK